MYKAKWSLRRPILPILILAVAALAVTACGTPTTAVTWPGLVARDNVVYVAYGPGVLAVDVAAEERLWAYPDEPRPSLYFYAPPAVGDGRLVVGDFGASKGMFSPGVAVSVYALDDDGQGTPATRWTAGEIAKDKIVAAPLIVGDRVYVGTSDNYLLALELDSGDLVWQFEAGHSIWAQPVFA
ncbi:MAG: PQQ-binding-like beta-propeller repeat protein, partial [Chloroflexota bacterium]